MHQNGQQKSQPTSVRKLRCAATTNSTQQQQLELLRTQRPAAFALQLVSSSVVCRPMRRATVAANTGIICLPQPH